MRIIKSATLCLAPKTDSALKAEAALLLLLLNLFCLNKSISFIFACELISLFAFFNFNYYIALFSFSIDSSGTIIMIIITIIITLMLTLMLMMTRKSLLATTNEAA